MNTGLRNEAGDRTARAGRNIQYSVFSIQYSDLSIEHPACSIRPASPLTHLCNDVTIQPCNYQSRRAFTLIELLIVIAIMAILAGLIIPATNIAAAAKKRSRAKGELNQIAHMVESYKIKLNYYPPSTNNNSAAVAPYPPLYYELEGTRLNNGLYTTLDGSASIAATAINSFFGVQGFQNVSQGGGDEGIAAQNFTKGSLRSGQYMEMDGGGGIRYIILGSSVEGPVMLTGVSSGKINPIGYNSASPTNSPRTYDLWLDILIRGKTERIFSSL